MRLPGIRNYACPEPEVAAQGSGSARVERLSTTDAASCQPNRVIIQAESTFIMRSPGKLIFSTLNALFPLYHNLKDFLNTEPSGVKTGKCMFDPMTFRDHTTLTACGEKTRTSCNCGSLHALET